jgi:hypothetical protein
MRQHVSSTYLAGRQLASQRQPKPARLGVLLFSSSDPQSRTIQDRLREPDSVFGKILLTTRPEGDLTVLVGCRACRHEHRICCWH